MARQVILVLAGVNGAGKSSVGGHLLSEVGIPWFNPDSYAKSLLDANLVAPAAANAEAWNEGMRRLDDALATDETFAFETTLGGHTVPRKLATVGNTHDLVIWFVGLDSVERHLARVASRVKRGGHAIAPEKIKERYVNSILNLIRLLPNISHLKVFDNSTEATRNGMLPEPQLILELKNGRILVPRSQKALKNTPDWAKPIVEAALQIR